MFVSIWRLRASHFQLVFPVVTLEKEEAVRVDKGLCGQRVSRRPYGELGSVERNFFLCFVCVDSNLGTIMSGWGCDEKNSDQLVDALRERMEHRGDTLQIKLAEKILQKTNDINEKLDLLKKHLDLEDAPTKVAMEGRQGNEKVLTHGLNETL